MYPTPRRRRERAAKKNMEKKATVDLRVHRVMRTVKMNQA
jgi:hypothetical protein